MRPPIIKMWGKTPFCPPIIRGKYFEKYYKKRKKAETETKK